MSGFNDATLQKGIENENLAGLLDIIMGPYSHIVIASRLESYIGPDDLQEYYWGTVAPDIRYLVSGMYRTETHLPADKILDYQVQYPHLKAFLQGYLVHCLSDELDFKQIIQQKFPFTMQQKLSRRRCAVILEFFNVEHAKPVQQTISGKDNLVLRELGIGGEYVTRFAQAVKRYLSAPSLESSVLLYQDIGMAGDGRIEKYRAAIELLQRNWLLKKLILFGLRTGNVNPEMTDLVKARLTEVNDGCYRKKPKTLE